MSAARLLQCARPSKALIQPMRLTDVLSAINSTEQVGTVPAALATYLAVEVSFGGRPNPC